MALNKELKDLRLHFGKVFNTESGKLVLKHLERYSHMNFPNYDNPNATYAKAGQQQLVDYIKGVLIALKKGGE